MLGKLNSNIDVLHILLGRRRKNEIVQRTLSDLSIDYPELKLADRVWNEVLEPQLIKLEKKRHNFIWLAVSCAGAFLCAVTAHVFLPMFSAALPGLPFAFYAAAIGGFAWSLSRARKVTETAHRVIAPAATAIFGLTFDPITDDNAIQSRKRFLRRARNGKGFVDGLLAKHKETYPNLTKVYRRLDAYHLLPSHHYIEFEDVIAGKRNDGAVRSFECRLIERDRKHADDDAGNITIKTHFAHIVQTQISKRFESRTVIRRKKKYSIGLETALQKRIGSLGGKLAGALRDKGGALGDMIGNTVANSSGAMGGMDTIKLESVEFAKQFEAFGTDQVDARFILSPDVMNALTRLSERYHAQELSIVFENSAAVLCLQAADKFEPQSFLSRLDQQTRFIQFVNDLVIIMDLVDTLRGKDWTAPIEGEEWLVNEDTQQRKA